MEHLLIEIDRSGGGGAGVGCNTQLHSGGQWGGGGGGKKKNCKTVKL